MKKKKVSSIAVNIKRGEQTKENLYIHTQGCEKKVKNLKEQRID
jgi:hypothetical protein